jgi:hypothetical protein
MASVLTTCPSCSKRIELDADSRRTECFKCHVGSIRLGFTQGKDDFHGPTVRERQRSQEAAMTAAGVSWDKLPEKATF